MKERKNERKKERKRERKTQFLVLKKMVHFLNTDYICYLNYFFFL